MKILQLLPALSYGDAIGNDTLAIRRMLEAEGYETAIFAERIGPRLPKDIAGAPDRIPEEKPDIIIYHGSTGSPLNRKLADLPGKKVLRYHNITPPEFFDPYDSTAAATARSGLEEMRFLADRVDYGISDSEFNRQCLLSMGYTCPIEVCPILIPFDDYKAEPNEDILSRYGDDGIRNIVFTGRVVPNKRHEDLLRMFYYYHNYYDKRSRLVFVGGLMVPYVEKLLHYSGELGLTDHVIFTGHVGFDEILAWYRAADAFVCMSEHEGFCVPVVEAMYFDIPVISYAATGVPNTMGGSGVLLADKEPKTAAAALNRVMTDGAYREGILEKQRRRLEDFSYDSVRKRFLDILDRITHE